ncbi:MAG: 50S ribosomal protein L12 [Candidatus Pacearchaeota archaeon]
MEYIYSALLLHKLGKEINEENLRKIISAAGVKIGPEEETKIKILVTSLKNVNIDKELENASFVSTIPSEIKSAPTQQKKEEEPKEEKKTAAVEGLSALFG